jgi:CRP/FNR family transcriptional regulator
MTQRNQTVIEILRQTSLFHTLDDNQLEQVSARLRETRLARGSSIFQQGQEGDYLYVIVTGRVRIYLSGADGREITFRIYGSGEIFGEFALLDGKPRSANATASSDVHALVLYREDFWELLEQNFDLARRLIAALTERLRYTTRTLERQSFLSARGKLAEVLVHLASLDSMGADTVRLELSQQELADYINTTREWVNQTLQSFVDEGLIRLERRAVIVLNSAELLKQAL